VRRCYMGTWSIAQRLWTLPRCRRKRLRISNALPTYQRPKAFASSMQGKFSTQLHFFIDVYNFSLLNGASNTAVTDVELQTDHTLYLKVTFCCNFFAWSLKYLLQDLRAPSTF
jgi:hypothetical protein